MEKFHHCSTRLRRFYVAGAEFLNSERLITPDINGLGHVSFSVIALP